MALGEVVWGFGSTNDLEGGFLCLAQGFLLDSWWISGGAVPAPSGLTSFKLCIYLH